EPPATVPAFRLTADALGAIRSLRLLFRERPSSPAKKPSDLVYGADEVPPLSVAVIGGLQHIGLLSIFLIYPLLVIKEAGVPPALSSNILSLVMVAIGVATLLQSLPRGPIGSGFLCPVSVTAVYLAPSLAAVKFG